MRNALRFMMFCLLMTGIGLAQSTNSGDIRGSVTDATGALIPGVTVTVLDVDTGVSKDFVTNQDGLFDTSSIVAGSYKLTFIKDGFESLVRGPITLQVGNTTVNAKLKVGSTKDQVVVTTDVPLLQTESGDQTATLDSKSMAQLPQVTQDWENFMILLPGTAGTPGSSNGSSNPGQVVSSNGNLPYSNVLADGASTTLSMSQNANPAIFETVSELQVSLSSFSAQYGVGGMIINQISKGGSSQFHGSGYDYLQNNALNAAQFGFLNDPNVPFLRYNNFGASVGGPILKKKMFFYFDYDQIVNHGSASNGTNSIPSAAEMQGVFANERPIFDPTTQTIAIDSKGNPYPVRKSFQEENGANALPSGLLDSVATKFQQFYPTPANHIAGGKFIPGSVGADGETQNNFFSSIPQSTPYRKFFGRLDYDVTPNNRITMSDTQSDTPVIYPNSVTACPIGCQAGDVDNNNSQVTDVWNISSRTINEARMGYTWQASFFNDLALGHGYAAQLGWQFAKADDIPAIQFTNTYPYAWIEPSINAVYKEHVFDPSDVVTMIRGKHILHFGGEFLIYRDDATNWGNTNAGTMAFSGQYTQQWTTDQAICGSATPGVACAVSGTGLEYADLLLGLAQSWSANVSPEYGARLKSPQVFIQDDWKVSPTLTVNLGLRYQINHGWNEIHGNETAFDPNLANPATGTQGAYWFGSTHANGRESLQANVFNTFLPRVGFSWLESPSTTFRGGFGLYSYNWSLDTYGSGMGASFANSGSISDQTNGITPVVKLDGPGTIFGTNTPLPYTASTTDPARYNGQSGPGYNEFHTPVPKIYQWNFAMQHEFGPNMVTEIAYVASHGFNLSYPTDLNAVPLDKFSSNDTASRPFPQFQGISGSTNNGISNYNSLQASVTRRLSSGLSMSFNYVWSHFLDDQDSSGWGSRGGPQNWQIANNPSSNYSNSNFDIRNSFKGYVVYQLPFGKGKKFLNRNALLDEAIGGWQISSTILLSSGNPFTVFGTQANYQLAGSMFPNRVPGVNIKPQHRSTRCEVGSNVNITTFSGAVVNTGCVNEWFNPAAFSLAAPGQFGDSRRNSVYGPGINQVNLSGSKTFSLPWEGIKIQIRADASNAFNHASFSPPGGGVNLVTDDKGNTIQKVGQPYTWYKTVQGADGAPVQVPTNQISGTTVGGRNVQLGARVTF
ncbi:TonB-dependent receptor [Acidicapsa ligni]|uniref:TonB-dependent receptor n=1 Tax=Acidicapsa ligni TaxID=542300 RepID=UPI0021DFAC2E|nr:carboxypeptidase-like regulatory domain-containing protein [Acidicapsa ligni]